VARCVLLAWPDVEHDDPTGIRRRAQLDAIHHSNVVGRDRGGQL
jgi:hypothetical protein